MEQFIINWIKAHKSLISVRTIERETGMPSHTLQKVMQGKRHLPEKYKSSLLDYIDKVTEKWVFPGSSINKHIDPIKGVDWERAAKALNSQKRKKRNDYLPSMASIVTEMINGIDSYSCEVVDIIRIWEGLNSGAVYNDPYSAASHLMTIENAIKQLTSIKELINRDITAHDKTEDHQQTAIGK